MKAICVDPAAPGKLALREVEEPRPDSHEAVVRVRAFSLNRGEVNRAQAAGDGARIGWDIAGEVLTPAANGSGPSAGTRVVGLSAAMNGWAEHCALPTHALTPVPPAVSLEAAATLPVAGLTALYGLERGERHLGSRVLITGATGGTGLFAVTLARLMGMQVVAHVRRPEQAAMVREAGAHEVVAHPEGEGLDRHGPYRLIFDGVGGDLLTRLFPLLDENGRIVLYGVTAGLTSTLAVRDFFRTGRGRIEGFLLFKEAEAEAAGKGLARLLTLLADGRLNAHIAVQQDWETIGTVAQDLLARRFSGKAVLTLGG